MLVRDCVCPTTGPLCIANVKTESTCEVLASAEVEQHQSGIGWNWEEAIDNKRCERAAEQTPIHSLFKVGGGRSSSQHDISRDKDILCGQTEPAAGRFAPAGTPAHTICIACLLSRFDVWRM
jgi:hypothetical protein